MINLKDSASAMYAIILGYHHRRIAENYVQNGNGAANYAEIPKLAEVAADQEITGLVNEINSYLSCMESEE